jgi:hypothetical protein
MRWAFDVVRGGLVAAGVVVAGAAILAWPVTTRQGVNYRLSEHRIPLALKLLGFLHRGAEYRHLVRMLVEPGADREATILRLFEWTREHIRPVPSGFPIIDDHVWDTIVRGYGTQDQAADVFATLCAYVGIPAHFRFLDAPGTRARLGVALVQLPRGGWGLFEPRHGVIVRHPDGRLASLEEMRADPTLIARSVPPQELLGQPLPRYFEELPTLAGGEPSKAEQQMPWRRVGMVLTQWMRRRPRPEAPAQP